MTAADALYVTLAEQLHARSLTDDRNLVEAPSFPAGISVFRLPT
jgi:predicted nucleic acid-binding protein